MSAFLPLVVVALRRHSRWFWFLALGLGLAACVGPPVPTPYPTAYWPTVIAATLQAGLPPTATPMPVTPPDPPSPTPTASPTAFPVTPTVALSPTATAAPTFPPATPPPTPIAYPILIGHSVEGRPLTVYRLGYGAEARLIVAGIHGGYEWNTIALAQQLLAYLKAHPDMVPPEQTLYLLPNLNPDGEAREHGNAGRGNAHGVDLNHNWPYNWAPDWRRTGCWNYLHLTGGEGPASEPETQALLRFIKMIRPAALISYHSAGGVIFDGGEGRFAPSVDLARTLAQASGYRYPPPNTGCEYTGNLTDWASLVMGIPAVDIELTDHTHTDFAQNLEVLRAFLQWQP